MVGIIQDSVSPSCKNCTHSVSVPGRFETERSKVSTLCSDRCSFPRRILNPERSGGRGEASEPNEFELSGIMLD